MGGEYLEDDEGWEEDEDWDDGEEVNNFRQDIGLTELEKSK